MSAHRLTRSVVCIAKRAAIYGLVGVLLSTGTVAVGCICFGKWPPNPAFYLSRSDANLPQVWPCRWFWQPLDNEPAPDLLMTAASVACVEETVGIAVVREGPDLNPYDQTRLVAGWPFGMTEYRTELDFWPSGRGKFRIPPSRYAWLRWTPDAFSSVVEVPTWELGTLKPIIIPLRPRFPGALLNTAFWATVTFAAVSMPGWICRLRRRPGACPICGYQANDLPICPECGTASEPATT